MTSVLPVSAFQAAALTWSAELVSVTLRGSFVLALAAVACAAMRRRSAALRHAVWCAALVALIAIPVASRIVPAWSIVVPRAPVSSVLEAARPSDPAIPTAPIELYGAAHTGGVVGAPHEPFPLLPSLGLTWLAIAAALLVRLAVVHRRLARLVARSCRISDPDWQRLLTSAARSLGLRRPVSLQLSAELPLPIVVGWRSPRIVLPASCAGWDRTCRREVLLHELAHVRRRDVLWLTGAQLIRSLFWFHPLVAWAVVHLRDEAERACDDAVLAAGERPSRYAGMLLAMASTPIPSIPAGAMAVLRRDRLSERIEAILAPDRSRLALGKITLLGVALVAAALASIAATPRIDSDAVPEKPVRTESVVAVVHHVPGSPVRVWSVRARLGPIATDSGDRDGNRRLDSPELLVENLTAHDVRSLRVELETPGWSRDAMWRDVAIPSHARERVRITRRDWSNEAPRAAAIRLTAAVTGVRFADGETWSSAAADEETRQLTPTPRGATAQPHPEAAGFPSEPAPVTDGDRIAARAFNPPGAPVVVVEAWTPRRSEPDERSSAERDFGRGHPVTSYPRLTLLNRSDRAVTDVRLRFKADRESHAVTVLHTPIPPGARLHFVRSGTMWGAPDVMTVQVLGVRFEDGTHWGSLGSTIDTRQRWIR